ncbi:positive regulator AgmR, partial [Vibrio cholerae]|nr:positive regulator AgmR [Vibrio cholerae]MVG01732.1 positive regulator AgmR [Vibrio cholerae]
MKPLNFQHVRPNQHQEKTQKPTCASWTLKDNFSERLSLDFDDSSL